MDNFINMDEQLINSDVKVIEVADKLIANVNTPEEYSQIKNTL